MAAVLYLTVFVTGLLSAFLFQGSKPLSLAASAAALVLFIADRWLLKNRKGMKRLCGVLGVVLVCCCICIPSAPTDFGLMDYRKQYKAYAKLVDKNKHEAAEEVRAEIRSKYGETDDVRFMAAAEALICGETDAAKSLADSFSDKTAYLYFMLYEDIIQQKYEDTETRADELRKLYVRAAKLHPEWGYVQKNAGVMLFLHEDYDQARYYLLSAMQNTDEPDGEILYYLGASLVEQGEYEKGMSLLGEALDYDLSETMKDNIYVYGIKAGWGKDES